MGRSGLGETLADVMDVRSTGVTIRGPRDKPQGATGRRVARSGASVCGVANGPCVSDLDPQPHEAAFSGLKSDLLRRAEGRR